MPVMVAGFLIGQLAAGYMASYLLTLTIAGQLLSFAAIQLISRGVGMLVSSAAGSLLRGGGDSDNPSNPQASALNRLASVREAVAPRQIVYGEVRAGGALTFFEQSADGDFTHAVFTMTGCGIDDIGDIYFNGENALIDRRLNEYGQSHAQGRFNQYALAARSLGNEASGVQPFDGLVTVSAGKWTDAHRQTGCAKVWITIRNKLEVFKNGLPSVSAVMRGRKVYDPRNSPGETKFSRNPALCLADYLTNGTFGLGESYASGIDEAMLIAAANACDEHVLLAGATATFTVDPITDELTLEDGAKQPRIGEGLRVSSSGGPGSLPSPLAADTTYYAVRADSGRIKLAASMADALAGVAVDVTQATDETLTLTYYSEPRYALDGSFLTTAEPGAIVRSMLAAMAGKAVRVGAKWHIYAGVYDTPTVELDEGDLVAPISGVNLVGLQENANGVKGIFTDPNSEWQQQSFPPIASATYLAEDNSVRQWKDLNLAPFVTSGTQAQRIAKIELLTIRQPLTIKCVFNLKAWRILAGGTVSFSFAKYGWVSKAWEAVETGLTIAPDGALAVEATLRETAAAIFDWSTSEEQETDIAPNTNLRAVPPNVTDFSFRINGDAVTFQWAPVVSSLGIIEYEIRYSDPDTDNWDLAGTLITAAGGFVSVNTAVAPGRWRFYIKAINSEGESLNAATAVGDTFLGGDYLPLVSVEQAPKWLQRSYAVRLGGTAGDYLSLPSNTYPDGLRFIAEALPAAGSPTMFATILSSVTAVAGLAVKLDSSGNIHAYVSDGVTTISQIVGQVEVGLPYHLYNRYADDTFDIYLNGLLLASVDCATVDADNVAVATCRVGAGFEGVIGEIVKYSGIYGEGELNGVALHGLTVAEHARRVYLGDEIGVLDHRNNFIYFVIASLSPAKLFQLWDFREGSGSSAYNALDKGVGSVAITLVGNVTWVPHWFSTKLCRHWTGKLIPVDRFPMSNYTSWAELSSFSPNPFRFCKQEASVIDLEVDSFARVSAAIESYLLPGKPSGRPLPIAQITVGDTDDHHANTGYGPFQSWGVGLGAQDDPVNEAFAGTFRYLRARILIDTDNGVSVIQGFSPGADAKFYTQAFSAQSVPSGSPSGKAITFDPPFHATPDVQMTMADGSGNAATYTGLSRTGVTALVKNSAGSETSGTVNVRARGA